MSLILKTISAFPRGRTTEELLVLVGAGFAHDKRVAALAELEELSRRGMIERGRDGKWGLRQANFVAQPDSNAPGMAKGALCASDLLMAASAAFVLDPMPSEEEAIDTTTRIAPSALLRYWRSALRADPRGATTQVSDKHGIEWSLISGRGPIVPGPDQTLKVTIDLEALPPAFREAIVRREGNENALAIGWPMAVGRDGGIPVFRPVGLFAARWERRDGSLVLVVDADDVLVNPDWIRAAARSTGWKRESLAELFDAADGAGLRAQDFLDRLQDAVASQVRGRIKGHDLAPNLDGTSQGIFDSAAIFLPTDSSFTAGAARDLDQISAWPDNRLARTSLAPVFDLAPENDLPTIPTVNVGSLNGEQLQAVRNACNHRLSVVTGPPGTGKSQAIVSMAASVLLSGGSVLVASKNHQALDAVEERLGALAPASPFVTRTLKPEEDLDIGFTEVLKQILDQDQAHHTGMIDALKIARVTDLARQRELSVDAIQQKAGLECEIADLEEKLEFRRALAAQSQSPRLRPSAPAAAARRSILARFIEFFRNLARIRRRSAIVPENRGLTSGATDREIAQRQERLRLESQGLDTSQDPITLGQSIQDLATSLIPTLMAHRTDIGEERRQIVGEAYDNWTFDGGKGQLPTDLARAVVAHRPLWLASVLGTPRRIPLYDELFDLVIFDEASQCDIATAIPLFARAKRAVVVGDDKQLSFIPQLGQAQDRNLMQAQNLPSSGMGRFAQSRRSLFDFASRVPGIARVTLRHQYRSAGPIVDYISEDFYGGVLETAYDPNRLVVPAGTKPGLAWEHVPAPALPQNGNVNPAEVSAIVRHLRKLLLEQGYKGSIGVITPFRAQVMALQEAIAAAIPETRRIGAELKVGTVDGFQGQERDLVLFSPCVGPRSPQSGLTFFQKDPRRLNVAISRARAVAMVFGDLDFARSGTSRSLQRLAARATEPRTQSGQSPFDSGWERRVAEAMKQRGLEFFPQHEIAGRRLDFALFGKTGVKLDLEVDGRRWHEGPDGRRKTSDLWRDHQLTSMGWKVRRFWVDELARDMEACLDIIERDLS